MVHCCFKDVLLVHFTGLNYIAILPKKQVREYSTYRPRSVLGKMKFTKADKQN